MTRKLLMEVRLRDFTRGPGTTFRYVYDMGDNWVHTVCLEQSLELEPAPKVARCVEGARARPPEDVGGPSGGGETVSFWSGGERRSDVRAFRQPGTLTLFRFNHQRLAAALQSRRSATSRPLRRSWHGSPRQPFESARPAFALRLNLKGGPLTERP
jgi:Plasmid pRiA4b ORF-3-like protein